MNGGVWVEFSEFFYHREKPFDNEKFNEFGFFCKWNCDCSFKDENLCKLNGSNFFSMFYLIFLGLTGAVLGVLNVEVLLN